MRFEKNHPGCNVQNGLVMVYRLDVGIPVRRLLEQVRGRDKEELVRESKTGEL